MAVLALALKLYGYLVGSSRLAAAACSNVKTLAEVVRGTMANASVLLVPA